MRKFVLFSLSMWLLSCGNNGKNAATAGDPPADTSKVSTQIDSFPVILKPWMIARGFEPGWFAEFYDDSVSISLDNGTKQLNFNYDFTTVEDRNFTAKLHSTVADHGKTYAEDIKIIVELKPCTEEASGESRERSIQLSYGGKTYRGCATVDL